MSLLNAIVLTARLKRQWEIMFNPFSQTEQELLPVCLGSCFGLLNAQLLTAFAPLPVTHVKMVLAPELHFIAFLLQCLRCASSKKKIIYLQIRLSKLGTDFFLLVIKRKKLKCPMLILHRAF